MLTTKIKKKNTKQRQQEKPSKPEMDKYEKAFIQVDRDKSGFIPLLLLDKLLNAADEPISDQEIKDGLDYLKKDIEEDSITLEEFREFLAIIHSPERILEAFKSFDKDRSGYLDKDELFKIMEQFGGGTLSRKEMEDIYVKLDENHDGKIKYKEFVEYWNST